MQQRLIRICIIGILACCIYGCAQSEGASLTAKATKGISEESIEQPPGIAEAESAQLPQMTEAENVQPTEIAEEGDEQTVEIPYEMPDWQVAYLEYMEDYIDNYPWQGDIYDLTKYSFIYVDDDDIPELIIYPGVSTSCDILTFHDGKIDVLSTDRDTVRYMEKKNLLDNYSGTMGFYHDYIYSIENGKWVYVTGGEYSDKYNDEHAAYDYNYRWEGEEVAEEVYKAKLNAIFDTEQAIDPKNFESFDEMMMYLSESKKVPK